MTVLSDGQWRLIESAYSNSTETIASIAARFGVSPATVSNRRTKFGWPPRRARAIKKQRTDPVAQSLPDTAALVARIYRLIILKLEQMEADMTDQSERTPAEKERETRALGTIIRAIDKAQGLQQESGGDGKQSANEPEAHAEADALRRELAERLVRIREADRQIED